MLKHSVLGTTVTFWTYLYHYPQLTVILACFFTLNSATLFLKM